MLRNSQQIKEYLAERRRIKENQKQQLKLKKEKENKEKAKEYQRNYYQLQKNIANTLKINKLQELQELACKIAQLHKNKNKEITTEYRVYKRPTRERNIKETDIYTKYELMNIDKLYPEEEGRVNWIKFYELVEKVKTKLKTL